MQTVITEVQLINFHLFFMWKKIKHAMIPGTARQIGFLTISNYFTNTKTHTFTECFSCPRH